MNEHDLVVVLKDGELTVTQPAKVEARVSIRNYDYRPEDEDRIQVDENGFWYVEEFR